MVNRERGVEPQTGTRAEAKPPPSEARGLEPDGNDRQLRRLAAFLEDAAGFQLALVSYDHRELREQQLERLAERLHGTEVWLTRLDLTETPQEKQLLQRLQGHLERLTVPEGKRPAVMVVGIEGTLDYSRLGRGAREGMAMLENANAQRDAFARHCPAAVAIWLNPTATSMFALHAPDVWHWRSGTFGFSGPAPSRQEIEQRLMGMPLLQSLSLPRRDKLERIASLRDLVAELDATPAGGTPRGRQRRAALLSELALAHLATGEARPAIVVLEETLAIAREIGDRRGEGGALGNLGSAYLALGDARKAIEYYEQALVIDREIGDRRGEGADLGNLGSAYLALGDARKAIEYYEQALVIDRKIGDRLGEGNDLGNLGLAYAALGDARKAIEYYEQQLVIAREIGDRRGEGTALGNLGLAYADLGDTRKAIEYYEQALVIDREIGDRQGQCAALGNLGNQWRKLGETEKARGCLEQGLRLALLARDPLRTVQVAWLLRRIYADTGEVASAVALEAFAFSRFQAMGYPQAETARANLARYRKQMGEEKFREARGRAPQTVAAIFRSLAGEPAAEMAAGTLSAFESPSDGA